MKKKVLFLCLATMLTFTGCNAENINNVGTALQNVEQEDIDEIESKAGAAVESMKESTLKALDVLEDASKSIESTHSEE